jgi:hypothetical protein
MPAQSRPSVAVIKRLQNQVRGAINYFGIDNTRRQGVDPSELRRLIREVVGAPHGKHITLRKQTPPGEHNEYALLYNGELLFRLVYVPWPEDYFGVYGRWHVRRHPDASWWRRSDGRANRSQHQPKRGTRRGRRPSR